MRTLFSCSIYSSDRSSMLFLINVILASLSLPTIASVVRLDHRVSLQLHSSNDGYICWCFFARTCGTDTTCRVLCCSLGRTPSSFLFFFFFKYVFSHVHTYHYDCASFYCLLLFSLIIRSVFRTGLFSIEIN